MSKVKKRELKEIREVFDRDYGSYASSPEEHEIHEENVTILRNYQTALSFFSGDMAFVVFENTDCKLILYKDKGTWKVNEHIMEGEYKQFLGEA